MGILQELQSLREEGVQRAHQAAALARAQSEADRERERAEWKKTVIASFESSLRDAASRGESRLVLRYTEPSTAATEAFAWYQEYCQSNGLGFDMHEWVQEGVYQDYGGLDYGYKDEFNVRITVVIPPASPVLATTPAS